MIPGNSLRHSWRSSLVTDASLFLFAVGIRLLYLRGAPAWPVSFGDGGSYLLAATHLLQGDWRQFFASEVAAYGGPVYPVIIALLLLLSGRRAEAIEALPRTRQLPDLNLVMPIQMVQAVLGALTCVAIAAAGRRTGSRLGRTAGLVGGAFFAILPSHILYVSYTNTEAAATAIAAAALALAIGPPQFWRQVGVGLILGIATTARMSLAYAAVLVPLFMIFGWCRPNLMRRIAAAGCGVTIVVAIVLAFRSLIIMAGGTPFVGPGAISNRIAAAVNAADPSHLGWSDDRVLPWEVDRITAKSWTLERDREEFSDREGIQRWRVPPDITKFIQGNHVQVNVTSTSLRSGAPAELRYIAPYQSSSPWQQIRPERSLEVSVPLTVLGNHHFVELKDTDRIADVTKVELVLPSLYASALPFLGTIPKIVTNSFMNFWYAEEFGNVVGSSEQFPNDLIQGFQHALLVLAAIGAARACAQFGAWAPILAFWAGGLIVGLKWIEQRHNMPFMPAVCLLAGLGATWPVMSFFVRRSYFYSLPFLIGAMFLVVGVISAALDALSVPLIAWTPLSDASVPLVLVGGAFMLWSDCSSLSSVPRLAALTPIFIFLFAYMCWLSTEPTPRWKHHYTDIPRDGTSLAQHITLRHLDARSIVKAAVLLDLEAMDRAANLVVRLNGTLIGETMENVRPLYPTNPNSQSMFRFLHETYAKGYQRPLYSWPQWWKIQFDPRLLSGSDVRIEISIGKNGPPLRIGSTSGGEPGSFVGPSISRTSIYRWRTTGDWRFWESFPNASAPACGGPIASCGTPGKVESTRLTGNISEPYGATLGIRLLAEDRSGNVALY